MNPKIIIGLGVMGVGGFFFYRWYNDPAVHLRRTLRQQPEIESAVLRPGFDFQAF